MCLPNWWSSWSVTEPDSTPFLFNHLASIAEGFSQRRERAAPLLCSLDEVRSGVCQGYKYITSHLSCPVLLFSPCLRFYLDDRAPCNPTYFKLTCIRDWGVNVSKSIPLGGVRRRTSSFPDGVVGVERARSTRLMDLDRQDGIVADTSPLRSPFFGVILNWTLWWLMGELAKIKYILGLSIILKKTLSAFISRKPSTLCRDLPLDLSNWEWQCFRQFDWWWSN